MNRRTYLSTVAGASIASGLAGCSGLIESRTVGQPPVVENRPDAVYYPSHIEGMAMVGSRSADDRSIALSYSYAHRFWTITGTRTNRVEVDDDDTIHLMASVWDPQTETAVPVASGLNVEILSGGSRVTQVNPWPMLSQNMGFHFGENVTLDGDGTYTVRVTAGGLGLGRSGAFAGRFDSSITATFDFEYRQSKRDDIAYRVLDDQQGQRGAVDPMDGMTPLSVVPAESSVPGVLGTGTSGDARVVIASERPDGTPGLVVSPRTPYNRFSLPMASLSATVERGGTTVFDGDLAAAIDPELGYYYVGDVGSLQPGDEITVSVDAPPQVSRHEGYETAFVEMGEVTVTV